MFGECHAHMIMDGVNYRNAVALHRDGVQDRYIREKFEAYRHAGISFVRDGGDAWGVSRRARELAGEYGITYRTPVFAIHKKGHYGGIVGFPFADMREYRALVWRVRAEGGDFIKVMFSGILDFSRRGQVTEPSLTREEIREMIHIAHEEGFAVMAHVNGAQAVKDAVECGVDSVEHGNFMDEECLQALAESRAVWVPTFVTIANLLGQGRFIDRELQFLKEEAAGRIRRGFELGAKIALGSDAGAWKVPHGRGLLDEYREFQAILLPDAPGRTPAAESQGAEPSADAFWAALPTKEELDRRLGDAEQEIRRRF